MSAKGQDFHDRLTEFMTEHVFPAEESYDAYRHAAGPDDHTVPPVVEELKKLAKDRGLWNLFLPVGVRADEPRVRAAGRADRLEHGARARSHRTARRRTPGTWRRCTCSRPRQQSKQWLEPLLNGEIRSAFAMTEPAVASSDARNIETTMLRDGGDYVINGRKWWISGAADPRCKILIVMGRTNPDAASHQQQSMILVPDRHPWGDGRAVAAGVRLAGPARALRDQLRQRAGAGGEPARRGGRRVRDRAGPLGARSHSPLHARHRGGRTRAWR